MIHRLALRAAIVLGLLLALGARAQAASVQDQVAAEALFQEALKLLRAGEYARACPKLAESQRLDPGSGTLLNLAHCLEKLGKTASSWATFKEGEAVARNTGNAERAKEAVRRAALLEPHLPKLTIVVPPPVRAVAGLRIKRNGEDVGEAQWGSAIPIDAGAVEVSAAAPGYKPWTGQVTVEGTTPASIEVPVLAKQPVEAAPVIGGANGSAQRTAGYTVLGVGAAGLVVGVITLGVDAAKHSTLAGQCPNGMCKAALQGDVSTYHTLGVVSSTGLVVGGALAVTGLAVALTAPKVPPRSAALVPLVGPGFVGVGGRFQ